MKTLMILLLTIVSVRCLAQKSDNKDVTEKKRTIMPVRIDDPKLMPVDRTASGDKLISAGQHNYSFTRHDLDKMPVWDFRDMIAVLPGVYQPRRGDGVQFYGARAIGTLYIVDGICVLPRQN